MAEVSPSSSLKMPRDAEYKGYVEIHFDVTRKLEFVRRVLSRHSPIKSEIMARAIRTSHSGPQQQGPPFLDYNYCLKCYHGNERSEPEMTSSAT
jgi:hypothetical protein